MKNLFFILLVIITISSKSQNQGNIWYFGDGAGISFASGNPVSISGGQTYLTPIGPHSEASSAICDSSGNLLLYSNGEKIWNRNHLIMPNGDSLLGNISSSQGALIIPQPSSNNIFYLFTTDAFQNNIANGLRYSVIDMCLNNNLGDVIQNRKNILLTDSVSEKLIAVKHSNGHDYWIITHKFNSDEFISFHLTINGIADTIISSVGSIHMEYCDSSTLPYRSAIGQMKASPNGSKLVIMNGQTCYSISELFDFNNTTGVVSNVIELETDSSAWMLYGASFSPDNSKLYIGSIMNDHIYQYDLTSGNGHPDSIRASKNIIYSYSGGLNECSFQLGPDGKIYIARRGENYISCISNPNLYGSACNYIDYAVDLNGNMCSYDLPNFLDSYEYDNGLINCEPTTNNYLSNSISEFYPNPTKGKFIINLNKFNKIVIFDINSQIILETTENSLDISNYSAGVYYIKIYKENETITGKLIKN